MIQCPTYRNVYEITETEFKAPEKVVTQNSKTELRFMYQAPSTSVLVMFEEGRIKIVVGRSVTDVTLKNVLGYAIKMKTPLEILRLEVLSNLRQVDDMVVLCNKILKEQDTTLDELRLELDQENSYND